jgi:hypothetical protein
VEKLWIPRELSQATHALIDAAFMDFGDHDQVVIVSPKTRVSEMYNLSSSLPTIFRQGIYTLCHIQDDPPRTNFYTTHDFFHLLPKPQH